MVAFKGRLPWSGLSRNVIGLGVVSLLNDASSEMIYPLLPLFLTHTLRASTTFVGVVEGIAETTASVLKLFSGWLSDCLRQRKRLVFWGYTLAAATRPLMAAALAPWHVLALRFADRTGKGLRTAPRDALLADSCTEETRGRAFGFHRAMDHLGAVVGPLVASALLAVWVGQYRMVFAWAAVPALFSLVVIWRGVQEIAPSGPAMGRPLRLTLRPFDWRFKVFLLIVLLFTLGNSSDAFLLLRASDLGVGDRWLPLLWVALHLVKTFSSTPGGALSDRWGRRGVIILGWLVYAGVYLGFAQAQTAGHAWALFLIYGLYFGLTEGTEKALVADLVPSPQRSLAYGMYHFTLGLAMLPASVLFGALWKWQGPALAFRVGAGLALTAAASLAALRWR
ncbi:MAG TPA: MFS transporter [Armatimonadetes bacterium]|nr:MFS transporter [Armatimonadota bacterium]